MSVRHIAQIMWTVGIEPETKLLLLALADQADTNGIFVRDDKLIQRVCNRKSDWIDEQFDILLDSNYIDAEAEDDLLYRITV